MNKSNDDVTVDALGEGKMKFLNRRLKHIENAYLELKKEPVLALLIFVIGFSCSLVIGELFSDAYGQLNPLGIEDRAEILTETLVQKSEDIEGKVVEISALLERIQAGEMQSPDELQGKISALLDSIEGIRPELINVVGLRNDMNLAVARQKDNDIEAVNMSPIPDVVTKMNDGATLCKERYTLAVSDNRYVNVSARPRISLTSPSGQYSIDEDAHIGNIFVIDDEFGRVVVTYRAYEIIADEAYYSFDFRCPE